MDNVTEKNNTFRRPYGVLVAEQLAADLVRDERDARIEEEDRAVLADQRTQDVRVLAEGAAKMLSETTPNCRHGRFTMFEAFGAVSDVECQMGYCHDCAAFLCVTQYYGASSWMDARPMTVEELATYSARMAGAQ